MTFKVKGLAVSLEIKYYLFYSRTTCDCVFTMLSAKTQSENKSAMDGLVPRLAIIAVRSCIRRLQVK